MIDLASISCAPMSFEAVSTLVVGSETSCPDNWSGQAVSPSQPYRVSVVRWVNAPFTDAEAFRLMISDTSGGHDQVVYTPPTAPAGLSLSEPRASQQETIVGRLVGPFRVRQRGHNLFDLEARFEEDH